MTPYGENGRRINWWIKDKDDRNLCSGAANINEEGKLVPVTYLEVIPISLEAFIAFKNTLKEEDKKELIITFATFGSRNNEVKRENADPYYKSLYKTTKEIIDESCDFQIAPAGYRPNWNLEHIPL